MVTYDQSGTVFTMNSNGSGESALVSGSEPSWGTRTMPIVQVTPSSTSFGDHVVGAPADTQSVTVTNAVAGAQASAPIFTGAR